MVAFLSYINSGYTKKFGGGYVMGWRLVKAEQLPWARRILCRGHKGVAVRELQRLLTEKGFYFGVTDGYYGVLTEEAVSRLQQDFRLRVDGIAGPAVREVLTPGFLPQGRLIYTLQKGDNLKAISQRFGVLPAAWRNAAGRGAGMLSGYPGQRLLLYRKAFFIWESTIADHQTPDYPVTGAIVSGMPDGAGEDVSAARRGTGLWYYLVDPGPFLKADDRVTRHDWVKFLEKLAKRYDQQIGLDLRGLVTSGTSGRDGLLQRRLQALGGRSVPFILLSLAVSPDGADQRFWTQLNVIGKYSRLIMVEPVWETSSSANLLAAAVQWEKTLPQLARTGVARRLLLVFPTHGWQWDQANQAQQISFKDLQLLRALYNRSGNETAPARLSRVEFFGQGQRQTLIYRDWEWWRGLLGQLVKYNFAGIVIRDFGEVANYWGLKLIAAAFGVLPASSLR
jgi:hypothetical protein